MVRTFKYRAKLSKEAETTCIQWLEQCRTLYNLALEQRIMIYNQSKKSLSFYNQCYYLPELKEAFSSFAKVNAQCLVNVLLRLDKAYQNFFRRVKLKQGKPGFPRFKSANRYNSFSLKQNGWRLEGRYLHLSNIGRLKLYPSLPPEGKIKTVTVSRTSIGKWFVCFSCDEVQPRVFPITDKAIGIDVGIKSFAVDSDGIVMENPKYLQESLKELRVKQRTLSRRKKGSHQRSKAKIQVAKLHEKISNQRKDFLHKVSSHYINNYKYIAIEDLQVSNMVRNHCLARSISDSSWGMFFQMLSYKAEEAGRVVVKVDPRNTSQKCSQCNAIVPKKLSERTHNCPNCGLVLDRDLNAALNIKRAGQAHRALTQVDVRPYVALESFVE